MTGRISLLVILLSALFAPRLLLSDRGAAFCRKEKSNALYKVFPVDEGGKNVGFKTFRDEFIQACRRKDLKFLLQHVDENICFSFGSVENNINAFIKEWKLDKNPALSLLWEELECILKMGGVFERDGSFSAPYTFALFPSDDANEFESVVCISSNTPLYEQPSVKSKIVANLCYDIVMFSAGQRGYHNYWQVKGKTGWLKVKTHQGEEGYMLNKYARSPIDYRAAFRKKKGVWKMTDFVSGD